MDCKHAVPAQDGPPRGPCHHSSPPPRSAPGSREGAPRGKPRRSKQDEATGGRLRPGRARFPPFPGLLAGAPGRKPTQGLGGSPRGSRGSEAKGQPKGGCRGRQGPAPSTPTGPPRPRQAPASRVLRAMGGHGGQDAGRAAPHPRGEGPRLGGPCGQGPGESHSKKKVYSNTSPPQETRKSSNKQANFTSKAT